MIQIRCQSFACTLVVLDDFYLMIFFERLGEALSDISTTSNHYALDRFVHSPHLSHHGTYVFLGSNKKYLILSLDHGIAFGDDGPVLAEDCSHTCVDIGHMLAEFL